MADKPQKITSLETRLSPEEVQIGLTPPCDGMPCKHIVSDMRWFETTSSPHRQPLFSYIICGNGLPYKDIKNR